MIDREKINVIITDDHVLFRKGVSAILSDFSFINSIHEAGNGIELLELLENLETLPDVILMDLRMPLMDGIEATAKIRELFSEIKIIVLTMEEDEQIILHMINEGINGYLLKNTDPEELEKALIKVVEKDFYFPEGIAHFIFKNFARNKERDNSIKVEISERELQVLDLICKELTALQIAEKLYLSVRTIEGHKKKLLEKTGAKNMAGLVVYAIKNKLVQI